MARRRRRLAPLPDTEWPRVTARTGTLIRLVGGRANPRAQIFLRRRAGVLRWSWSVYHCRLSATSALVVGALIDSGRAMTRRQAWWAARAVAERGRPIR